MSGAEPLNEPVEGGAGGDAQRAPGYTSESTAAVAEQPESMLTATPEPDLAPIGKSDAEQESADALGRESKSEPAAVAEPEPELHSHLETVAGAVPGSPPEPAPRSADKPEPEPEREPEDESASAAEAGLEVEAAALPDSARAAAGASANPLEMRQERSPPPRIGGAMGSTSPRQPHRDASGSPAPIPSKCRSESSPEPNLASSRDATTLQASSVPRSIRECAITGSVGRKQSGGYDGRLCDLQQRLSAVEGAPNTNLTARFLLESSVANVLAESKLSPTGPTENHRHVDPTLRNSLLQAAQLMEARQPKMPNRQMFKRKMVLLGYQEVGKTSLRKCFEADPMFFKKLPEVKSTTGVEIQSQSIRVDGDEVQLVLSDFAGQEAYHSHTLFLTERSIFVLVWKISAVEQDLSSSGISSNEEERLKSWIAEVYAKFPRAKIAFIATHLDELRVQGQRSVEMILSKVEAKMKSFMESIAIPDPNTGDRQMNDIVGNFAASCKTRVFLASGRLRHLSGGKLSSLLRVFAEAAHRDCLQDPQYPAAAIPGRHIRLMDEINALKQKCPDKLLLPLSELVHTAVRFGVESDAELLHVALLMHSWNIIYLCNQHRIGDNIFLILHPMWLSRLAAALFSYAHVLRTPLHLRSIIGGLEYMVSRAEAADMHLMKKGYLRWPLVKVLFRQPLVDLMRREPDDSDYVMCVQLLAALSLLVPVSVPCDDLALLVEETPVLGKSSAPSQSANVLTRYFIPSLSPFGTPPSLKLLAPVFFNRGVQVKFEFNMLPSEMWWRFQSRLQEMQQIIVLHQPRGVVDTTEEEELEEYRLQEADDEHSRWNDGMWLMGKSCRVFLYREGKREIRIFSTETTSRGAEEVLEEVERVITELLSEYRGLRRDVYVACPEPQCDGWHNADDVEMSTTVHCTKCGQDVESESIVVSGVGPRGERHFNDALLEEASELLYFSLEHSACVKMSGYLGIPYRGPPLGCSLEDGQSQSEEDSVDLTPLDQHVDYMHALDKIVRAVLLRNLWDRVNEEARRRRLIEVDHYPL